MEVIFTRGTTMRIHTVKRGERISEISREYGVSEESVRNNNSLYEGEAIAGEQLLILTPTRTYTVRRGDTPERISLRFGTSRRELYSQNPRVCECGLVPGSEIALKYAEPIYGMGVANGYFYRGCPISALKRALPYLTYVTVAAARCDGTDIHTTFDAREAVSCAKDGEKIPLLRIYREDSHAPQGEDGIRFCEAVIDVASRGGYRGVVLSECNDPGYAQLLVELRRRMIGCDLILISEMSRSSPASSNEYSDGSVLSYDKYAEDTPPSFSEGERRVFSDFAYSAESSKTFISLPALAKWGRGYCGISEALSTARQYGCEIETDSDTLLSSFRSARRGEFIFSSLENIKATLDTLSEYGFMGVSFDIMRSPISHLMMYGCLFRTAHHTVSRAIEGCSQGG